MSRAEVWFLTSKKTENPSDSRFQTNGELTLYRSVRFLGTTTTERDNVGATTLPWSLLLVRACVAIALGRQGAK